MLGAWEEAHSQLQMQIFQKPIKLDAIKFVPLNSYCRERFSKFEKLGTFRKFVSEWMAELSIKYVSCMKWLWFGVFPETFFNLWIILQVL